MKMIEHEREQLEMITVSHCFQIENDSDQQYKTVQNDGTARQT